MALCVGQEESTTHFSKTQEFSKMCFISVQACLFSAPGCFKYKSQGI